jgi:hypothetical protein
MRREGNERRVTTSKKPWARRDEHRREERVDRDDREQRLRDEAHAIDHRWTSSDDGSRDDDKKTVASEGESEDEDDTTGSDHIVVATTIAINVEAHEAPTNIDRDAETAAIATIN